MHTYWKYVSVCALHIRNSCILLLPLVRIAHNHKRLQQPKMALCGSHVYTSFPLPHNPVLCWVWPGWLHI